MTTIGTPRVVVLGGGFGGLEAAFYLRMRLGDRARISLVSDQDHFLYKPNTIYIPFGMDPERLKIPLARPTQRKDITSSRPTLVKSIPGRRRSWSMARSCRMISWSWRLAPE